MKLHVENSTGGNMFTLFAHMQTPIYASKLCVLGFQSSCERSDVFAIIISHVSKTVRVLLMRLLPMFYCYPCSKPVLMRWKIYKYINIYIYIYILIKYKSGDITEQFNNRNNMYYTIYIDIRVGTWRSDDDHSVGKNLL